MPKVARKIIGWVLRVGVTVTLFLLLFYPEVFGIKGFVPVTLQGLWEEIKGISARSFWPWVLFAFIAKSIGIFSSIARWHFLLLGQGIRMRAFDLIQSFLVGRFIGMFLPGTVGLDGYRFYYVARHAKKPAESASVIIVEKITGFVGLTVLVFLTLPLGIHVVNFRLLPLIAILAILLFAIAFAFLLLFNPILIHAFFAAIPMPQGLRNKLKRFEDSLAAYSHQRRYLMIALALAVVVHLGTVFLYFGTFSALRAPNVGLSEILFASPLMIYGTVVGPSVGGEGIREAVFALILGAKTGTAKAVLAGHLGFWVGEVLAVIGGIFFLLQGAVHRPKMIIKDLEELRKEAIEKGVKAKEFTVPPSEIRRHFLNWLYFGALGGAWAGALVGLVEAVIISVTQRLPEHVALGYGPLVYSALGAFIGLAVCAVGLFVSLLKLKQVHKSAPFAIGFGFAAFALIYQVAMFRIRRDIMAEHAVPPLGKLLVLCGAALVFTAAVTALRKRLKSKDCPRPARPLVSLAALILVGFIAGSIWRAKPASVAGVEAVADKPNILLVMVDTLRADALSCYGNEQVKTPNVDALADDSIIFKNVFSQASWTKPSAATMLTGLYPSTHGAYGKVHVLSKEIELLPEALQKAGYLTLGIADVVHLSPAFGFDQGYHYYTYLAPDYFFFATESSERLLAYQLARQIRERYVSKKKWVQHYYQPAEVVTDKAIDVLDKSEAGKKSFFMYLHYMDPHDPYFRHPPDGYAIARVHTPHPDPSKKEEMWNLYLREVEHFDAEFGRLIKNLKEKGIYDRTMIILTADHGEEFFEHGGWWHGETLYTEQIHVPIILKLPKHGYPSNSPLKVVDSQVSIVDIVPTALEAADADIPDGVQGKSLFPVIAQEEATCRRIFSEEDFTGNVLFALRNCDYKLILANEGNPRGLPEVALFDVEKDPKEQENLAQTPYYGTTIDGMRSDIESIKSFLKKGAYVAGTKELTPEEKEKLKALGYIQ